MVASTPDALDVINCAATFTIGHVLAEEGEPFGGQETPVEESLATMTPETHPHLTKAFHGGYANADRQYELGLRSMLDGFEARYVQGHGAVAGRWLGAR